MAAGASYPFSIILKAVDQLSGPLGKVESQLSKIGNKTKGVGRTMTGALTLPILGIGAGVIGIGAKFESSLNKVAALTGEVGTPAMAAMTEQAKKLGADTVFSASESAAAMSVLAKASLDANRIMAATPIVLELAAAGELEMAASADIVTSILSSQREETDKLGVRTDQLVAGFISAKTDLGELGEAMKAAGSVMRDQNIAFSEQIGLLAALAQGGKAGAEGGLVMRRSISRLLAGIPAVNQQLAALKIRQEQVFDEQGNLRSFTGLLELLEQRGAGATEIFRIFGEIAGPAILNLLGQGTAGIRERTAALDEVSTAGSRARIAGVMMQGAVGATEELMGALETLALQVNESGLLPWFTKTVRTLGGYVDRLNEASPNTLKWATIIAGATATVGPFLIVMGSLATSIGGLSTLLTVGIPTLYGWATALVTTVIPATIAWTVALLTNPITWIVLAVVALIAAGYALVRNWDSVVAWLSGAWDTIRSGAEASIGWLWDKLVQLADWAVPDWLAGLFGGSGDREFKITGLDDERLRSIAAPPSLVGEGAPQSQTKVTVDFRDVPDGVNVSSESRGDGPPPEIGLGFAMGGAL